MTRVSAFLAACLALAGCVSYDEGAAEAVSALSGGDGQTAVRWSEEVAEDSRSEALGTVESARVNMLLGKMDVAEQRFRKAIDAAIDHKEKDPVIKLGDMAGTALASTVTDDWSIEYYLSPYEINLALEYGILAQLFAGKRDDALVDARLACYVQDKLADEYGATLQKLKDSVKGKDGGARAGEVDRIVGERNAELNEMIAATRNSWENPVLWWLTGVLFEADGNWESAKQSYRRAGTTGAGNPFFEADMNRCDSGGVTPSAGRAKLVVVMDDGFVPRRAALKIPLRIYATMSIDLPTYKGVGAYQPKAVAIAGSKGLTSAAVGLNVRSLAARALSDAMPGIVMRNITRAAVNAGIQVAGRAAYKANGKSDGAAVVLLTAELVNLFMVMSREADTRTWVTLPDAQYVWCDSDMQPGSYELNVEIAGVANKVPVTLEAGETKLLWIGNCGKFRHQLTTLGKH